MVHQTEDGQDHARPLHKSAHREDAELRVQCHRRINQPVSNN